MSFLMSASFATATGPPPHSLHPSPRPLPFPVLHPSHCMEYVHAGIVGAGTNNARLAGLLRGLGSYYYKEPTMLFLVRIAQGLVHMGKGLLTLNPYHTDNQLVSGHPSSSTLLILFGHARQAVLFLKVKVCGCV